MRVLVKIFVGLVVIVVLAVAGLGIAASTVDINQYRDKIATSLSDQLGRSVKFGGPIRLALSLHGVGVAVQDAEIGNPTWASRPNMAKIGSLQLGVALMPLLDHKLVISEFDVSNADILLETNAGGQHNWDMKPAAAAGTVPGTPAKKTIATTTPPPSGSASATPVGVRVDELSIMNSQVAMRDKDGKTSTLKVDKIILAPEGHGIAINVNASFNGAPIKLALKTGTADLMGETKWPYNAELSYDKYHLTAQGSADTAAKSIELNPYELAAGGSSLHGQIMYSTNGAKPEIRGTLMGDKLDPADFKPAETADAAAPAAGATPPAGQPKPLFSTAPLDVSALKSADASIDVSIENVTAGNGSLKHVTGKLVLANGNLTVSPFKASLGESALDGDVKLEGTSPAQYSLSFKAPGVDIASLLDMMGTKAFLTGKGDADIQLSGSGNSLHELASNTNGHILVTADGGTISASDAGGIAAGLAQIFAPGSNGNPTLKCLAVRFNVANGVGKDNGILADSSASTVAGTGGFDLREETVGLTLNASPKLVDTHGISPAVQISGPLAAPKIGVDTVGAVQNVAGALLKNQTGTAGALAGMLGGGKGGAQSSVPALAADVPAGQNACVYTLDHKGAATAAAPATGNNSGVKDVAGQATQKAKNIGNQLMQGILGH